MKKPYFTAVPNEVMDHYLPELSHGELKVLLVILRRTYGWHRDTDTLSLSRLAELTGLGKSTCCEAAKSLEERGLVSRKQNTGSDGGCSATTYEIEFKDSPSFDTADTPVPEIDPPVRQAEPLKEETKEALERKETLSSPTPSQEEELPSTDPATLARVWNSTKGLKRLGVGQRRKITEHGPIPLSYDELRDALKRLATWSTKADVLNILRVFLCDPRSWLTYQTVPKENPLTHKSFSEWEDIYISIGASYIASDFEKARPFWDDLSEEDHAKAREHTLTCDPAFIKSPKNYLKDREFDRKPRPAPKARITSLLEQA